MRSKTYIYCLSCGQERYVDSTIDVTDEEIELDRVTDVFL